VDDCAGHSVSRLCGAGCRLDRAGFKPFADRLRLTDTDPTGGQFGFDSYKLADVVTPQIADNLRRQFPVGPD
jgi:hypothetical protein